MFNFDNTFEIHDDIEVLKRMGMAFGLEKGLCSDTDLQKCIRTVPKALEPYVFGKLIKCNIAENSRNFYFCSQDRQLC